MFFFFVVMFWNGCHMVAKCTSAQLWVQAGISPFLFVFLVDFPFFRNV